MSVLHGRLFLDKVCQDLRDWIVGFLVYPPPRRAYLEFGFKSTDPYWFGSTARPALDLESLDLESLDANLHLKGYPSWIETCIGNNPWITVLDLDKPTPN
jgi:hypothetical protein